MDKFTWANQTEIHPYALAALVVLALMVLVLPRRYTPLPILIMACLVPARQRIVIFELDWTYLRLLVLAGWIGVLVRGDTRGFKQLPLDNCVIALVIVTTLAATARTLSMDIFVRHLGSSFDAAGTYLLLRMCIRGWNDIVLGLKLLVLLSIPVMIAMMFENQTGYNVFHVFGGVPEFTLVREGRIRAQAAFSHPILAGCFWASLLPLFAGLAASKRANVLWAVIGVTTSLICVYLSASTTPMLGALVAVLGGALYVVRQRMKLLRWSLLGLLVSLHLVMKAPVWHLISRIDAVGGSTGWQRYILIDRSIHRFSEWFLLGIDDTSSWGHGMMDVTNEYLLRGFRGGFIALCIFIAIITLGYQAAGRIWRSERPYRAEMILGWALGVSLFTHTVMFIAVSYFGQISIIWWLLIATLGSLAARQPHRKRQRVPAKQKKRSRDERAQMGVPTDSRTLKPPLGKDLLALR